MPTIRCKFCGEPIITSSSGDIKAQWKLLKPDRCNFIYGCIGTYHMKFHEPLLDNEIFNSLIDSYYESKPN